MVWLLTKVEPRLAYRVLKLTADTLGKSSTTLSVLLAFDLEGFVGLLLWL